MLSHCLVVFGPSLDLCSRCMSLSSLSSFCGSGFLCGSSCSGFPLSGSFCGGLASAFLRMSFSLSLLCFSAAILCPFNFVVCSFFCLSRLFYVSLKGACCCLLSSSWLNVFPGESLCVFVSLCGSFSSSLWSFEAVPFSFLLVFLFQQP